MIAKFCFLAKPQSTQNKIYGYRFACFAALRDYKIQNDQHVYQLKSCTKVHSLYLRTETINSTITGTGTAGKQGYQSLPSMDKPVYQDTALADRVQPQVSAAQPAPGQMHRHDCESGTG